MVLGTNQLPGEPGAEPIVVRRPFTPVTWILLGGSIAVFAGRPLLAQLTGWQLPSGALYGPLVAFGQWWRTLSYAFEHGGILHIAFNGMALYNLGVGLEPSVRPWRLALISVATCLGSAAFALYFSFDSPTVGASGIILGWLGAALPIVTKQSQRMLLITLVQVAALSLIPGVSWQAHLGGFLFGVPFGLALRRGTPRFSIVAPILIFLSAVAVLVAVNPSRVGLPTPARQSIEIVP